MSENFRGTFRSRTPPHSALSTLAIPARLAVMQKNYSSALTLIAAAIVWNAAAVFHGSQRNNSKEFALFSMGFAGFLVLLALFKWGRDV